MCVCVFVCIDVVCVLIAGVFATAAISSTCLGCKQLSHRTTAALLRGKVEARHFVRSRSAHIAARRSQPLHNVPMTCSSTRYQHTWRRYLTLRRSYAKINNLPRLQDALPFGPASPYRWGRAPCHLAWTARAPPPEHATPPVSQVQLGAAGSAMQVQCRLCSPRGCPAAPRSEADSSFFSGVRYSVLPQAMAALGKTLRSELAQITISISHIPPAPLPLFPHLPNGLSRALSLARALYTSLHCAMLITTSRKRTGRLKTTKMWISAATARLRPFACALLSVLVPRSLQLSVTVKCWLGTLRCCGEAHSALRVFQQACAARPAFSVLIATAPRRRPGPSRCWCPSLFSCPPD